MANKPPAAKLTVLDADTPVEKPKKEKTKFKPFSMNLLALEDTIRIPTGIAPLDLYTNGGLPHGTTTLLSGVEGGGKSTTATLAIAGFQKLFPNKMCVYQCAENKIDPNWAKTLGVDLSRVQVFWPQSTEESQYIARKTMEERKDVGMMVIDSLASLCPEKETDEDPGDEHMAIAARLNNKFLRQMVAIQCQLVAADNPIAVILLNQERQKTGLFGGTVLPGGNGQRFQAATWIKFHRSEVRMHPKFNIPIKTLIRFTLVKNIGGSAGYPGEFYIHSTPHGNWKVGDIEDHGFTWLWAAQRLGIIQNKGIKGFEFRGEFGKKEDWLAKWQKDAHVYGSIKSALGQQFKDWLASKVQISIEKQEAELHETLAEGGEFLGEPSNGEAAAGVGE